MGDSDEKSQFGLPAWQRAQAPDDSAAKDNTTSSEPATLEQAQKFLQDDEVRKASRDRKVEFLRSKGIAQSNIDKLLGDHDGQEAATVQESKETSRDAEPSTPIPEPQVAEKKDGQPPIITYPEFLTKPTRPPPLVTVDGFLNTLKAFGAVSALVYGTSKYVVEPMVDSLTAARIDFHESASQNLSKLIEKLESTVSEIPDAALHTDIKAAANDLDDDDSSYDDPTELFHRDIGVQTSRPPSPSPITAATVATPEVASPAQKLGGLVASVRAVRDGYVREADAYDGTMGELDEFGRDMSKLAYPQNHYDYSMSYGGPAMAGEADDEIKRAKENIRRVKGVLLSTRSFPMGPVR